MRLIWSESALADLERFAAFLQEHHPNLAKRIAPEIIKHARMIASYPEIGRLVERGGTYRELSMTIRNGTYVFRYSVRRDHIRMLRVFHGREQRER